MAYFRRSFGYGRRYRRWYGRRGWTRSWRRGSLNRRIQSGTRTFSMTIPVEGIYSMIVDSGSFNTHVYAVSPFKYAPGAAYADVIQCPVVMTELYRTYAKLYDEVKIDWASYEVSILDVIGNGGTFSACRLWTSVDRKNCVGDMVIPMTAYQVRTSSGAQGVMMTNNSRTVVRRYLAARDLQERITYHDCTVGIGSEGNPPYQVMQDEAWIAASSNLMFFSPALYYFLEMNQAPSAQQAITVSVKVKYGVTFRNAKYGLTSAAPTKDAGVDIRSVVDEGGLAGKSEVKLESPKPTLTGMAKAAVARLALNASGGGCDEYESGENDWHEDIEFLVDKVGVDGVRTYFPEGSCDLYDEYLKERGVMDDDPTELVKDSKS